MDIESLQSNLINFIINLGYSIHSVRELKKFNFNKLLLEEKQKLENYLMDELNISSWLTISDVETYQELIQCINDAEELESDCYMDCED